jgi:uncharacterized protein YndB with AHSA1/START domain
VHDVTVSGIVRADARDVFDFLVDSRNDELWCPLASDVHLVEGEPGAGALYTFRQGGGIAAEPVRIRTTVAERPARLVWEDADRPHRYRSTIELAEHGGRTRVTQTNRVELPDRVRQTLWWTFAHGVLRLQLRNLRRELER